MLKTIIRRTSDQGSLASLPLHPLLQRIYFSRGIRHSQDLERGLEHLLSFHLLKNISIAVECLYRALQQQHHIVIVGDFDADGATSVAVAVSALTRLGAAKVSYIVPDRFKYGYGLTPEIVSVAAELQPDVLITVDNGISSLEGVAHAKSLGIQVVITDHHLAGQELPSADAIVNPNQPGDEFPSKNLAGVGVIFYLMLALRSHCRQLGWFTDRQLTDPNMSDLLDLVALGTVADVVPLDKNNRILVQQGIRRIRSGKARPGIQSLLAIGNRDEKNITASDLGFVVGPRLNAAGRLEDMSLGIACLLATDHEQAMRMAQQLDSLNKERREIETTMQQQALAALAQFNPNQNLPSGICLHDPLWHQGVIGIVAGRIKDRVHRPVIAFATIHEEELKGSARSVAGVHIRDILDAIAKRHPSLIHKFGGHAMAAGLSIHPKHYSAFSQAFAEEVSRQIDPSLLQGRMESDGELDELDFSVEVADLLREAGPWGQGFPEPLFDNYFQPLEQRIVGMRHLKMQLRPINSQRIFDAIAFNVDIAHWPNHRVDKIHAIYRLDINEFRGQRKLQLVIEHLQAAPE